MTHQPDPTSLQGSPGFIMHVKWARMAEPMSWIIDSIDTFTERLTRELGLTDWHVDDYGLWHAKTRDDKEASIRAFTIDTDPDDDHDRIWGYSYVLDGHSDHLKLTFHLNASSLFVSTKMPSSRVTVHLQYLGSDRTLPAVAETVLTASVETWQPLEATLTSSTLIDASLAFNQQTNRKLPNWSIGVGYRIWLADEVGPVQTLARGVTSARLDGGTLLSTPDHWPARRVVEAMRATLDANGLHQLPHTPGRYQGLPPD